MPLPPLPFWTMLKKCTNRLGGLPLLRWYNALLHKFRCSCYICHYLFKSFIYGIFICAAGIIALLLLSTSPQLRGATCRLGLWWYKYCRCSTSRGPNRTKVVDIHKISIISIFFKPPICLTNPKYLDYLLVYLTRWLYDTHTCYGIPSSRHLANMDPLLCARVPGEHRVHEPDLIIATAWKK